jgi:hypothetical protein
MKPRKRTASNRPAAGPWPVAAATPLAPGTRHAPGSGRTARPRRRLPGRPSSAGCPALPRDSRGGGAGSRPCRRRGRRPRRGAPNRSSGTGRERCAAAQPGEVDLCGPRHQASDQRQDETDRGDRRWRTGEAARPTLGRVGAARARQPDVASRQGAALPARTTVSGRPLEVREGVRRAGNAAPRRDSHHAGVVRRDRRRRGLLIQTSPIPLRDSQWVMTGAVA